MEKIKDIIGKDNREEGAKYIEERGFDVLSTVRYLESLYAKQ